MKTDSIVPRTGWTGLISLAIVIAAVIGFASSRSSSPPAPPHDTLAAWAAARPFQIPRRGLAAATSGHRLYVLGGVDAAGNYVREVEWATIDADGTLSSWQTTTPLPAGRIYAAAVATSHHIYLLGGARGELGDRNFPIAEVIAAPIHPDGQLGNWQTMPPLTTPRRGLTALHHHGVLYALGGYNGQFLRTTERSLIGADGRPGPWQEEAEQSQQDRYIHSAATANGFVYLIAGHLEHGGTLSDADTETARILPDGQLSPWRLLRNRLHNPRFLAAAASLDGHLIIAGGHDGRRRLNTVEMAALRANGNLAPWQPAPPLRQARSALALVTWNEYIYALGGAGRQGALRSVERSHLTHDSPEKP